MDLAHYLQILFRRKWIILVSTLATLAVVYAATTFMTPTYTTTTTLRLTTARSGAQDFLQYDIFYTDRLMNTYANIAKTGRYVEAMMNRLGLESPPSIDVEVILNTELLEISITDPDPVLARDAANTLAEVLIDNSEQLNTATLNPGEVDSAAVVPVTTIFIVDEAWLPTSPSGPNTRLFLMLGAVSGVIVGIGLALVFESLDDRVYAVEHIETITHAPILARIPKADNKRGRHLLGVIYPQAESFRHLRTQLFAVTHHDPTLSLLVTSPEPEEGKSTVLANLAFAIAQAGRRTLVIDANLRKPHLHTMFGVENTHGLSDYLNEIFEDYAVIQHTAFPNVDIIPSGEEVLIPSELLAGERMKTLIDTMSDTYAAILIDAPAFLPVTDAGIVGQLVDGALLVVEKNFATAETIESTCLQFQALNIRLLGVVVNKTRMLTGRGYDAPVVKVHPRDVDEPVSYYVQRRRPRRSSSSRLMKRLRHTRIL